MNLQRSISQWWFCRSNMTSSPTETETIDLTTLSRGNLADKIIRTKTQMRMSKICLCIRILCEGALNRIAKCFSFWETFICSQRYRSLEQLSTTSRKMKNISLVVSFRALSNWGSGRHDRCHLLRALDESIQLTKRQWRLVESTQLDY